MARNRFPRVETRDQLRRLVDGEMRALQADADVAGGFFLAGELLDELVVQEREASVMRAICRVMEPLGEGIDELGVPSQEAAMADAEWTNELGAATEDTTATFGKRVLRPRLINKRVKVSRKLLRSQPNAERWIVESLADAVATPQETSFIQGSGSGEPWGLLNTSGLPTYTTAGSGTLIGDDIRGWIFSLPARFQERATILTSVDFLRYVLRLKDGEGNYLFPDYRGQILGKRVAFSDGMPDIVDSGDNLVAGEYAAVIGDFRWYWIVDDADITVQVLQELYAAENEVGINVYQSTDGMGVLANAFYALKIKS